MSYGYGSMWGGTKEDNRRRLIFFVVCAIIGLFLAVGFVGACHHDMATMKDRQTTHNLHVSQNMPIGTVVNEPQELGEGLYLIKVQMDSDVSARPKQYSAITAQPENFPLGSKAGLKNVTASGENTFGDMFHIAFKP